MSEEVALYCSWDPNDGTRNEVQSMMADVKDSKGLEALRAIVNPQKRLKFGTAGLRSKMGPGYQCMNDLVVMQTTQGLIQYLYQFENEDKEHLKNRGVVIGYDHRKLGTLSSKGFARIAAAVFLHEGFKVYLLEDFVPTPFVAFAVRNLNCIGGIMVTASHNPMQDNGYKLYWRNGSQIIAPHDANIANCILTNLTPWTRYSYSDEHVVSHPHAKDVTEVIANLYLASIESLSDRRKENCDSTLEVVYTALHGVGARWVQRAFNSFGFPPERLHQVASQCDPDPAFPTVKFPNPEEKGALDEAIKTANSIPTCSLIIANDPDADRLAVAEKDGSGWRILTGNEIGVLLGHWQIKRWNEATKNNAVFRVPHAGKPAVLASVVSSRMLKAIAEAEGILYFDTLTGFKWLGNKTIELRESGVPVLFAYEEALGYCVGDVVCDKDGVSAAMVIAEIALTLSREGKTIQAQLRDISDTYGTFVSYNSYLISHNASTTAAIFRRLREGGPEGGYWQECAGAHIVSIKDVTKGFEVAGKGAPSKASALPATADEMIMFEFSNRVSVTLRTSGTEPKIKYYTEIASTPGREGSIEKEQEKASLAGMLKDFVERLIEEMLQPDLHGLIRP